MLQTILLVFAFVFLVLEAFRVSVPRVVLGWAGLALWLLTVLLGSWHHIQ